MEAFLIHIGVNPADVVAGFSGGMCAALVTTGSRPTLWGVATSILIGACAGGYAGPVAPAYVGLKPSPFASFVIGLCGMPLCRMFIKGAERLRWVPPPQE